MKHCATSITRRRLKLSARAPDINENNMIGSAVDACTSATISTESEMVVIIQAAPTDWIREPKLEERLASQTVLKISCLNGASGDARSVTSSTFFFGRHWRYYPVISETPPIASRRIPPSRQFAGFSQLHTIRLNAPVENLAPDSRFLV